MRGVGSTVLRKPERAVLEINGGSYKMKTISDGLFAIVWRKGERLLVEKTDGGSRACGKVLQILPPGTVEVKPGQGLLKRYGNREHESWEGRKKRLPFVKISLLEDER
jgi:hypothetical protein